MMTMRAIAVLMTGAAITIPVAVDAQTSTNRVTLPVWAVGITKIDAQRAAGQPLAPPLIGAPPPLE